jgi:hypothetical protein
MKIHVAKPRVAMTTHRDQPRGPKRIGSVVARLMARTGYAQEQGSEALATAWAFAAPDHLAGHSRPGLVRRGVLDVFVTHSAIVQEMAFHKHEVLARLQAKLPTAGITDIRCRMADTG